MKRLLVMAVLVVTALGFSVTTGVTAAASSGSGTSFKATYTIANPADGGITTWTCSGSHVANKNVVKDSETCVISGDTTGYVAGSYSGAPVGNFPPFGAVVWNSDYPPTLGLQATSWTMTVVENGNGIFTDTILALY
jgi:hypothetical protein